MTCRNTGYIIYLSKEDGVHDISKLVVNKRQVHWVVRNTKNSK